MLVSAPTSGRQRGSQASGSSASPYTTPRSASASNVSNLTPSSPASAARSAGARVNGSANRGSPRSTRATSASRASGGGPRSNSPASSRSAGTQDRARLTSVNQAMRFWTRTSRSSPQLRTKNPHSRRTASATDCQSVFRHVKTHFCHWSEVMSSALDVHIRKTYLETCQLWHFIIGSSTWLALPGRFCIFQSLVKTWSSNKNEYNRNDARTCVSHDVHTQ